MEEVTDLRRVRATLPVSYLVTVNVSPKPNATVMVRVQIQSQGDKGRVRTQRDLAVDVGSCPAPMAPA